MLNDFYVYIMANKGNTVVYTGVTNNLERRVYEHKNGLLEGFTKKYNVHKLVYFEQYSEPKVAISREKQIKGFSRAKKNHLIEKDNPYWIDLTEDWYK